MESPFASPRARRMDLQEDSHQGLILWKPVLVRHCEQHFYVRIEDAHSLILQPNATMARAVRCSASLNPGACEHRAEREGCPFLLNRQGTPNNYTPFPGPAPQVQPGPGLPRRHLGQHNDGNSFPIG